MFIVSRSSFPPVDTYKAYQRRRYGAGETADSATLLPLLHFPFFPPQQPASSIPCSSLVSSSSLDTSNDYRDLGFDEPRKKVPVVKTAEEAKKPIPTAAAAAVRWYCGSGDPGVGGGRGAGDREAGSGYSAGDGGGDSVGDGWM